MKTLRHILCCSFLLISAGADAADTPYKEKLYKLSTLMLMPGATSKDTPEWSVSLGDYKKRNVPVYFGTCLESRYDLDTHGRPIPASAAYFKHMVFFPVQSSEGTYTVGATDRHGRPTILLRATDPNGGRISIKRQAEIDVTGQGGPAEWAVFKINTEYLLRNRLLRLIQPENFVSAIDEPTNVKCPSRDGYKTADTDGMDQFYRKQGWNTPTPLPGH